MSLPTQRRNMASLAISVLIPLGYLWFYTPYGMDTTDFGYFYGYAWRILNGQMPYRDFFYIKPALPLYWHALWLKLTPYEWQILGGKVGFCLSILSSSWLGALSLGRIFQLGRLKLATPLLATGAFVFSIHTFPHMPWHTADGVLFSSASLFTALSGHPLLSGLLAACAVLCKQSFALIPIGIGLTLYFRKQPALSFLLAFGGAIAFWVAWLWGNGAWDDFRSMTTGQLAFAEALDAGIFIYLKQNWLLPVLSLLPMLFCRIAGRKVPTWLGPAFCYLTALAIWYGADVLVKQTWIGYGTSWPTLFMCLGALTLCLPGTFLVPYAVEPNLGSIVTGFGTALLIAWSAAISGGYKIPAFFAAPLLLAFYLWHGHFYGSAKALAWYAVAIGVLMFAIGWRYPYTFPIRPLDYRDLQYDAGEIYPQARGVKVDRDMYERLAELKELRNRYGPAYKTLPGFSHAYYLNHDKPVASSDWLIDWEINGEIDRLFQELADKNITVFMERDQLDTTQADGYARAGYGVPQLVRHNWKIVQETPHFVVFQKP